MSLAVKRTNVKFTPDPRRVIPRFFMPGDLDRAWSIIERVMTLTEEQTQDTLMLVLTNFSKRHRNITKVFERHYENLRWVFEKKEHDPDALPLNKRMVIGSYFTMEYSIESAAFFNPSAVEDPYHEQVGRICYAYEKGSDWERDWFRLLASHVGKAPRDVLERLAYDQEFTVEDQVAIQTQEEADALAKRILAGEPEIAETAGGRQMAIYDISALSGVFLGRQVFEQHGVDLSLIRISERKWHLACSPSAPIDMSDLLGRHESGGLTFRVGGRPKRLLSIEIGKQMPASSDAHESIVAWVASRL